MEDLHKDVGLKKMTRILIHTFPLGCLLVDFLLNAMIVSIRRFIITMLILFAYLFINMGVTLATDKPVYAPLTYKDIITLYFIVICLVVEGSSILLLSWLSKKKEILYIMTHESQKQK